MGRCITIGALIVIAFIVALRIYGNRQYDAGKIEGTKLSAKDLESAANNGRDAARAELQSARDAIDVSNRSLQQARSTLSAQRSSIDSSLHDQLDAIGQKLSEGNQHVSTTSDSDLPDLVRELNQRFRTNPDWTPLRVDDSGALRVCEGPNNCTNAAVGQ
jgi:hypothetical protein